MTQMLPTVVWQEGGVWIGHLRDHPDYWTQGETRDDLQAHLMDLQNDLTSGTIPGISPARERGVS